MKNKVFIIGLPRTGTTSICVALLHLGYKVAHTAYTEKAITTAEVIADTPIFCDYQQLAEQYPQAKFIYLTRDLSLWLPSIRQLLQRMHKNIVRDDGGFNPILKRCYKKVFAPFCLENVKQDEFLKQCYQRHYDEVQCYFVKRPQDILFIDVSHANAYQQMIDFLNIQHQLYDVENPCFEKINIGGKITAWNKIKHPNKVDANMR